MKKKICTLYLIILLFTFFIYTFAQSKTNEVFNSKTLYLSEGLLIPSSVQNGKFNTILILDSSIEKIFLDKLELDIIENGYFKISFFVIPLNSKKNQISLFVHKKEKIIEYKIPVIENQPYEKADIILEDNKKQIVSEENSEKRKEETIFFNNLLNTKSQIRYFTLPFVNPLDNMKIISAFGKSRTYKDKNLNILYTSTHLGVDLKASENTKVYAISAGKVTFAGYSITRGNCIYLDHGFGLYSSYFHLNKISVSIDQIVFAGDLIGFSGSTGVSTGPHLHFGTAFSGISFDPISLISEMNELEENFVKIQSYKK
ncbi:MAG: M23 family metallopeptidase [Spirochaetota bacterium]